MEKKPRYSGGVETRVESDATTFESPKCYRCAEVLKKAGPLIPTAGVTYYHGRAHEDGEDAFAVKTFFENADNITGNSNVNKGETALHVSGTRRTAERFAEKRAGWGGTKPEVAEVVIPDQDASFFDCSNTDLSPNPEVAAEQSQAIIESLPPVLEGITLSMEDYKSIDTKAFEEFIRGRMGRKNMLIQESEIPFIAKKLKISMDGARNIAGAMNVFQYVSTRQNPAAGMSSCLSAMIGQKGDPVIKLDDVVAMKSDEVAKDADGKTIRKEYPISREYLHQWMRNMHIVGVKMDIISATLGMEEVHDAYEIISLERARSKEQLEKEHEMRHKSYGSAALRLFSMLRRPETQRKQDVDSPLKYSEMDKPSTPRSLVKSAMSVSPKYEKLYESSTGVKEGFTLRQHTETALSVYDASFKSTLPRSVFDFGRLCLLVHDIGKPIARKKGQDQEAFNYDYAQQFLRDINAPKEVVAAVPEIITIGTEAASKIMLAETPEDKKAARRELATVSAQIAKKLFNIKPTDKEFTSCVQTVFNICYAIVTCDGAAYSTFSSTYAPKGGYGFHHRNANERFSRTFNSNKVNPNFVRVKSQ